jgi:hypothetical protein
MPVGLLIFQCIAGKTGIAVIVGTDKLGQAIGCEVTD